MSLPLSDATLRLIEEQMKKRDLRSADELVQAALVSLDEQDPLRRAGDDVLEAIYPGFREKIAQGVADAEAGRVSDGEEFFTELEREEQEFANQQGRKTA